METKYVVIRDMSAGNESVGEMWQETRIFNGTDTLTEVMVWALDGLQLGPSKKSITLTKADNR